VALATGPNDEEEDNSTGCMFSMTPGKNRYSDPLPQLSWYLPKLICTLHHFLNSAK